MMSRKQFISFLEKIFIVSIIVLPLLLEGIGYANAYIMYFYLVLPAFLYIYFTLFHKKLVFPKRLAVLYLFFLLSLTVSSLFFSVDKETSLVWLSYFLSLSFVFIFFYNVILSERTFFYAVTFLSLIFAGLSLLVGQGDNLSISLLFNQIQYIIPRTEYQLIYPYVPQHNYLGDFLGLLQLFVSIFT